LIAVPADHDLRDRLGHVRWLGGGSGAGKSTIAARLMAEHGLRLYGTDEAIQRHVPRSTAARHPLLHEFLAMDLDERWLNRSPEVMLETFHGFRGEAFELIVDDLLALPEEPLILVEGFRLLPRLIAPLLSDPSQAVWLIPTPDFRRIAFEARGFTWVTPERTSDPVRALANLLERDRLFTEQVANEAAAQALTIIEVDGTLGIEALTDRVGNALGLSTPS
jgi:2-phosphoglycerate kinase